MIAYCLQNELKLSDWDFEGFEKMPFVDMKFYWSELCLKKCHHIVPAGFECDPGNDIEFLAVTPEGEKFPFGPLVKCTNVDQIKITNYLGLQEFSMNERLYGTIMHHGVDRLYEWHNDLEELAINEGLGSIEALARIGFEDEVIIRKLIHWTDKRY
ncbi:hypothetical protein GCM10011318_28720 [Phaeocystidibacter marisrubri]|nr:hypothetical protein GCM10011318_28720 [Phaeocystidibacter marisrubri]